jgi:integrase
MTDRKRGNKEGSVYQRASDGKWVASWYDPDGKRRVSYHPTEAAAKRALRKALSRTDTGLPGADSGMSYRAAFERWRRSGLLVSRLDPKTQRVYVDTTKLHVLPVIGGRALRDLRKSDVAEVFATMAEAGLSSAYQRQAKKAISHVLRWAIDEGLIHLNATQGVSPVAVATEPKAVPTPAETKKLIKAAPDARMRCVVGLWAYAALRIGESLDLTWSDVDLTNDALHFTGKGDKSRSVPISAPLRRLLVAWRKEQARMRLASPWWSDGPAYVITTEVGTRSDEHNLRKDFRPWAQAILPRVTPHSMRHGAATALMEAGVNPKVVAELLGHSSVRITLDTYTRVRPAMTRDAAEQLGKAIGGV